MPGKCPAKGHGSSVRGMSKGTSNTCTNENNQITENGLHGGPFRVLDSLSAL